jgi:hypothetical protein
LARHGSGRNNEHPRPRCARGNGRWNRRWPDVDIEREFISLTRILERLEAAAPAQAAKVIVFDACRDNPWDVITAAKTGQKTRGLARVAIVEKAEKGERDVGLGAGYFRIFAFSTAAGETALDGRGRHSPYTQALLRKLPQQAQPGTPAALVVLLA